METDHVPIGAVAFRTNPTELLQSALCMWSESTQAPIEVAEELVQTAMYYEALARTWDEIRALPQLRPRRAR